MGALYEAFKHRCTSTTWKKFAQANPGEASRTTQYIQHLDAGNFDAAPPKMVSLFGQGDLGMLQYLASLIPVVTPPPPPPPPASGKHLGIYLDPGDWNPPAGRTYLQEYEAAVAAGLPVNFAMMDLNANDVKGVGNTGQIVLIPRGESAAQLSQYYVPAASVKTASGQAMVSEAVIYDEPGVDSTTVAAVKGLYASIKHLTPDVTCSITQYSTGDVKQQVQWVKSGGFADKIIWDNYPSRTGWDLASFKSGIDTILSAGVRLGVVLDCFQATNYPMPTAAQLSSLVEYVLSLGDSVEDHIIYAWGDTQSGAPHLQDNADLMKVLKEYYAV